MTFHTLNPWAILAAAVSAFVLGGVWYSPVAFGAAWKTGKRIRKRRPSSSHRKSLCYLVYVELGYGTELGNVSQRSENDLGLGSDRRLPRRIWLGRNGHRHSFCL